METFTWLVALLLGASALVALARRTGVPYPALLALAGVGAAFIPGAPDVGIDPEIALAVFVAPVLVDAAYDASLRELRLNWIPITALSLVVVGLTIAAVAATARALFPAMPWSVAVALGAIVAPPDAASTTAVMSQLNAPRRIRQLLEGESLFNDAGSLIVYRLAVAATLTHSDISPAAVAPRLLLVAGASVVAGFLTAHLVWRVHARIRHAPTAILLQFLSTFAVWILAERLGLSAVITTVVHAITISHLPDRIGPRLRIPTYAVWETAVFVLNVVAFLLIGLQVDAILGGLAPSERLRLIQAGLWVLGAAVAARVAWVLSYNAAVRLKNHLFGVNLPEGVMRPNFRGGVIISWAGMRGIVTLAAALALPAHFPFRNEVLFMAFSVVLGTLVLQGLTLGPLIRALGLRDDGGFERETQATRAAALKAALTSLADCGDQEAATSVRREFEAALKTDGPKVLGAAPHAEVRRRAVGAARAAITELRRAGRIGDEAFHLVEEELDWAEMSSGAAAIAE